MIAVVSTGGKQYKVSKGAVIDVEKIDGQAGETVTLNKVLMIDEGGDLKVGAPYLEGITVTCEVARQFKGPKIIVFKKKRRKNYRRKNGHRQWYTQLKVTDINK
ncbi:MAG: 50S ribosomal protein L21 [Nitrospinaceae bacterium]